MADNPTQPAAQDDEAAQIAKLDKAGLQEWNSMIPSLGKDMPVEEQRRWRKQADLLSKRAVELRSQELDALKLNDKEKQILKLYDQGMQVYAIALKVFDFANSDTVGKVMLTIRKEHADDFEELEDVASTKGYTGVGVSK